MSTPITVVCFLEDTYLQKSTYVDIGNQTDQGVGKLDSILLDYFNVQTAITDRRVDRLSILATPALGTMKLWFDNFYVENNEIWKYISSVQYNKIFNILEACTLHQNLTIDTLNTILTTDPAFMDTYVAGSVILSSTRTSCMVQTTEQISISVPKQFQFIVSIVVNGETYDIEFKVYVDREAFKANYPYTTITKVVSPFDPAYFFGGVVYSNIYDAVCSSQEFANGRIDEAIGEFDQTGAYLFKTKYVPDAGVYYNIPFQIFHKGPKRPTTAMCRQAIKEYLLGLNMANEGTVKTLFPELFIECLFYIIPVWDMTTSRPDRLIYPAITDSLSVMWDKVNKFIPMTYTDFITKGSMLLNGQNDMFSFVYPDALNTDLSTIREVYPTFTAHSSQEAEYEYMDTADKAFASLLNKCFSVLNGEIVSTDFIEVIIEGHRYLTFSSGKAEIYILTKDSYLEGV